MNIKELHNTAMALVSGGKGILAADESKRTANRRFEIYEIPQTEEMRRTYRNLLLSTNGSENFLNGVILHDETLKQMTNEGIPFQSLLEQKGIIPGIKVDAGTSALAGFPGEVVTEGLDGLRERLQEYLELGARFAKWRSVITIKGDDLPTDEAIRANAHVLGRYAGLCQEVGIVPVVEPEVLLSGDHNIEKSEQTLEKTLNIVFEELVRYRVVLEAVLLKTSMVLAGKENKIDEAVLVAEKTVSALKKSVPEMVPGVVFLSGGQAPEQATRNLNEISKRGPFPWNVSFSFARALQEPALDIWRGKEENFFEAQEAYLERLKLNFLANRGEYKEKSKN